MATTTKLYVRYRYHHYNTGSANNADHTAHVSCGNIDEARTVRDRINKILARDMSYPIMSEKDKEFCDKYRLCDDGDGFLLKPKAFIVEITTTEKFID